MVYRAPLARFLRRLFNALRPAHAEPDLAREVASHLALLEDDFRRRGLSAEDARLAARRAFGGVEQTKDRHRDARSFVWLDDARRDLQYAMRTLCRQPGFASIAVLTLALGIGANTAIFSVVNAVLLHPLPFKGSDRLVWLHENAPAAESPNGRAIQFDGMRVTELLELKARSHTLSHVAAYGLAQVTIPGGADPVRRELVSVSAAAFPMMGIQPVIGRWFTSEDERSRERVIVLSDASWQRYFNRDPLALGRTLSFNGNRFSGNVALGEPYTIVGVMPSTFRLPNDEAQFWIPLALAPPADGRPRRTLMIARLADGVSIKAAEDEVTGIVQGLRGAPAGPKGPALQIGVAPLRRFEFVRLQDLVGAPVRPVMLLLTTAVAFVLLIACANVANLQLGRSAARQREVAVRVALGAGRGRLVRQALTESVLLSTLGGAAGTLLAYGGVRLFRSLATGLTRMDLGTRAMFPRVDAIAIDPFVLAFAAAISVGTGLLFGLAPAARHAGARPMDVLRNGSGGTRRGIGVRPRVSAQDALVIAEIAMATLLFVGGGLLMRSFVKLASVDPGYSPTNVLTFQVSLPGERSPAQLKAYAEDLIARLQAVPGVDAAAYANQLPMVNLKDTAGGFWRTPTLPKVLPPADIAPDARLISRDYFNVMGIRVLVGRALSERDGAGQPRVLLINRELARREFAGENPVGQIAYIGRQPDPWQIVGVVENVRQFGFDRASDPQFFADLRQWPVAGSMPTFPAGAYYALRTVADPSRVLAVARDIVREREPQASIENVATMDQLVSNSMTRPRMYAVLLGIFAGVAVGLAAAGIYGVMAYTVAERTREIGIRTALGAQRADVIGLVLGQSASLTAAGLAIGLAGAMALTRYLEGLLFGLAPLDALTFVAVPVLFATVATLAAYVPARRAARVDPLVALRCE